jgi:hypothetical protein
MMPQGSMMFFPLLIALVYLGLIAYVLWLATRLVAAVERIARSFEGRARSDEPPA